MRIHFFGADSFSVKCLEALKGHNITVVSRPQKPSGRGQKAVRDSPLVQFAKKAGHNLKFAETTPEFLDLLEEKPDMAVAVSYGRLVPSEYLCKLPFGGLNVHPSLLPALRGAAPLHRAIMQQLPFTGVSVQTLDPHKFDHGKILWQSEPQPLDGQTLPRLSAELAELGAQGLKHVVDNELYLGEGLRPSWTPSWAKVVSKEEHKIKLASTVAEVLAQSRALGKLYFEHEMGGRPSRTLVWDLCEAGASGASGASPAPGASSPYALVPPHTPTLLTIQLADGVVGAATVQAAGYAAETPAEYARKLQKRKIKL